MFTFTAGQWLALVQHELLLFAGICFLLGALDDFAVDLMWFWLKLTGKAHTPRLGKDDLIGEELAGPAAVFVPAWNEAAVITDTVRHAVTAWPQNNLRLYIGCYRNDPATIAAVMAAASDRRVRLVIHDRIGPSTKADCLNRLYQALCDDEQRSGIRARMVVFHDAEDMVDAAALPLLDRAIDTAEFVQLPVLALPQRDSPWIGSHYCEEFAEAHGKALVVRDALGTEIPAAGVGCAASRAALERLAERHGGVRPFAADSLTEDYELGIGVALQGGRSRFIRARHANGKLIATRAYFPASLDQAVRQKTRWVHGIAFQGWDRLGWSKSIAATWMRLRDRRGPMTALVLLIAYALLALATLGWGAQQLGYGTAQPLTSGLKILLTLNFAAFLWRGVMRYGFTAFEFGWAEGLRAVMRIPLSNIISIMSGRRALFAYVRTLRGHAIDWDKTDHAAHPARLPADDNAARLSAT